MSIIAIVLFSTLAISAFSCVFPQEAQAKITTSELKKGKVFTGYATISGSYDGASVFTASFSGDMSVLGRRTVYCQNHTAASTPNGRHPYTATVTDVDQKNGKVTVKVVITPPNPAGTARDAKGRLYGYQRAGGYFTFDHDFTGKLTTTKTEVGSSGKITVKGAKYGIYATESAARNKKNALTTVTTSSKGTFTVTLKSGTYWLREISAPWPYLVNTTPKKITITGGDTKSIKVTDKKTAKIKIKKRITLPSGATSTEYIGRASSPTATVTSTVNGSTVTTSITAHANLSNIRASSPTSSLISAPSLNVTSLSAGQTTSFTQKIDTSSGWSVGKAWAYLCTVSSSQGSATTKVALPNSSLKGTKYGVYSKKTCVASSRLGYITLDDSGTGTYGEKKGETLELSTTYYLKEESVASKYAINNKVYAVKTKASSNSTVTQIATDSYNILSLKKVSSYPQYTSKYSQFSIAGAQYGVFKSMADAQTRQASRAIAVLTCDASGNASYTGLSTGTYYVAELPSAVTRPAGYGISALYGNAIIDAGLAMPSSTKIGTTPMGKFIVDETIRPITLSNGTSASFTSYENIPVRIKIDKLSTNPGLLSIPAFSLKGAVFGIYDNLAAAQNAKVVTYGTNEQLDTSGTVAVIYGGADGSTVASKELPLKNYYIKEIRVPASYRVDGSSYWQIGSSKTTSEIRKITVNDFLNSTRYADGILCTPTISQRVNEPVVKLNIEKTTTDLDNSIAEDLYDGMFSLEGAQFAVYKTKDDAEKDINRISFPVDTGTPNLITIGKGGKSNTAILSAALNYWVMEVKPPVSKDGMESAYITDSTPFEVVFSQSAQTHYLSAKKPNSLKPISLSIKKTVYDFDEDGNKLHIQQNNAYNDQSLEGALFAVFDRQEQANNCPSTEDVTDFDVEQRAYTAGAIAVVKTNSGGTCETIKNLPWSPYGYFVVEIKAPTSGCYRLNKEVYHMGYDTAKQGDFAETSFSITNVSINCEVRIAEVPNYYYILIRKTNSKEELFEDQDNYPLEGVHFAVYATKEEAQAATKENPGNPLYNIYTEKTEHKDGSVTYDAITGVTGPGTFWAREFSSGRNNLGSFQDNSTPIRVEASIGGIPDYENTFITPGANNKTAKEIAEQR